MCSDNGEEVEDALMVDVVDDGCRGCVSGLGFDRMG